MPISRSIFLQNSRKYYSFISYSHAYYYFTDSLYMRILSQVVYCNQCLTFTDAERIAGQVDSSLVKILIRDREDEWDAYRSIIQTRDAPEKCPASGQSPRTRVWPESEEAWSIGPSSIDRLCSVPLFLVHDVA